MPKKVNCTICDTICFSQADKPMCRTCSSRSRRIHPCTRTYKRYHAMQRKYGVDQSGFEVLWIAFEGRCGMCRKELTMPKSSRGQPPDAAVLDHDHTTGNIRGLLCNSCNKGIGLLKDSPDLILTAYKWVGGKDEH